MAPPTDTLRPADTSARANGNGVTAVIPIRGAGPQSRSGWLSGVGAGWAAVIVALAVAISPIASGYYNFGLWGPLALGAMVLLVIVAWTARPQLTRPGVVACAALAALLALSAASMLWAQSGENAWTAVNRLALYAVLFAIVVLSVRERRVARVVVTLLGLASLITCVWLTASFLFGGGQGAFLTRRLNLPIGYINGTAGLLVMGLWPWMAYAEAAERRIVRTGALVAASLIASTVVLTESRAVIPATIVSALVVLLSPGGRTRRAINLLIVVASVACTLPWTLAIYSDGGLAARALPPGHGPLRSAAVAVILAALGAGVVRFALSRAAERIEPRRRGSLTRRLGAGMLIATVLAVVAGVAVGNGWISREYRTFTALRVNASATVRFADASGFRYDLWRVAVKEFRLHPLGGVGAGNYDADYYRFRRNPEYVVQPHSLELQMLAELGIGGLLALVLFCAAIFRAGFARAGTLASTDPLIRLAALGLFTAWLVDTSVDWLYDIPGLAGAAIVAAALLVVPARRAPEAGDAGGRHRNRGMQVVLVAGFAVVALLAASIGRQYAATRYRAAGQHELKSSPQHAIGTLREAAHLDPYSLSTLYALSAAYARLDDYQQARDALLLAAEREPTNYVPPALLGDLATRRGDDATALSDYRRSLALNPRDPGLRQTVAQAEGAAR